MTVKLFLEEDDIITIDEIAKVFSDINRELRLWHINAKYSKSLTEPDLKKIRNTVFSKTLPSLIKKIEVSLRKNFNLHHK